MMVLCRGKKEATTQSSSWRFTEQYQSPVVSHHHSLFYLCSHAARLHVRKALQLTQKHTTFRKKMQLRSKRSWIDKWLIKQRLRDILTNLDTWWIIEINYFANLTNIYWLRLIEREDPWDALWVLDCLLAFMFSPWTLGRCDGPFHAVLFMYALKKEVQYDGNSVFLQSQWVVQYDYR